MEQQLLQVCLVAFISVMTLLTVMAGTIALVTKIFPVEKAGTDEAVIAAIQCVASAVVPGAVVTSITEEK